jgi:hypothetical protein
MTTAFSVAFTEGFQAGLAKWRGGWTTEQISHEARFRSSPYVPRTEAYSQGMDAASTALLGWYDEAALRARRWGMSRRDATALALTARDS